MFYGHKEICSTQEISKNAQNSIDLVLNTMNILCMPNKIVKTKFPIVDRTEPICALTSFFPKGFATTYTDFSSEMSQQAFCKDFSGTDSMLGGDQLDFIAYQFLCIICMIESFRTQDPQN